MSSLVTINAVIKVLKYLVNEFLGLHVLRLYRSKSFHGEGEIFGIFQINFKLIYLRTTRLLITYNLNTIF